MKKIAIILLSFAWISQGFSQSFTNINAGLEGVTFSAASWIDVDMDGDLDVFISGMDGNSADRSILYENTGGDHFVEVTGLAVLPMSNGAFDWGDYDQDGDMDLLIQGFSNGAVYTKLYGNLGNLEFAEKSLDIIQVDLGSVNWIDYNNDGFPDICITGFEDVTSTYHSQIYLNDRNGSFQLQEQIVLPGIAYSKSKWADFDNDGDMDLFITGLQENSAALGILYINDGGSFSPSLNNFANVWIGDAAWGDYDSDGDMDLAVTGFETNSGNRYTKLYNNDGQGNFNEVVTSFAGVSHSSFEWGDMDNDGDLDVLLTGAYETGSGWVRISKIYENQDGAFVDTQANLPVVFWGDSRWGDYDADGDLDILFTGYQPDGNIYSGIYRNDAANANTPPSIPSGLSVNEENNTLTMIWNASTDNETTDNALSYNIYIKREDGSYYWSPNAIDNTGWMLKPDWGNVGQALTWSISDMETAYYSFSVQAVDQGFMSSEFAPEFYFSVGNVGLAEFDQHSQLNIIPNPARESIRLSTDEICKLSIRDIQGKLLWLQEKYQPQENIDVSFLKAGVYVLEVLDTKGLQMTKLMIE